MVSLGGSGAAEWDADFSFSEKKSNVWSRFVHFGAGWPSWEYRKCRLLEGVGSSWHHSGDRCGPRHAFSGKHYKYTCSSKVAILRFWGQQSFERTAKISTWDPFLSPSPGEPSRMFFSNQNTQFQRSVFFGYLDLGTHLVESLAVTFFPNLSAVACPLLY